MRVWAFCMVCPRLLWWMTYRCGWVFCVCFLLLFYFFYSRWPTKTSWTWLGRSMTWQRPPRKWKLRQQPKVCWVIHVLVPLAALWSYTFSWALAYISCLLGIFWWSKWAPILVFILVGRCHLVLHQIRLLRFLLFNHFLLRFLFFRLPWSSSGRGSSTRRWFGCALSCSPVLSDLFAHNYCSSARFATQHTTDGALGQNI